LQARDIGRITPLLTLGRNCRWRVSQQLVDGNTRWAAFMWVQGSVAMYSNRSCQETLAALMEEQAQVNAALIMRRCLPYLTDGASFSLRRGLVKFCAALWRWTGVEIMQRTF